MFIIKFLDIEFTKFSIPLIIKICYILTIVVGTIITGNMIYNKFHILIILVYLGGIICCRILCEFVIIIFNIVNHLKNIEILCKTKHEN